MNIVSIIERCIEYSIKSDEIIQKINYYEELIKNLSADGDISFYNREFKKEMHYNEKCNEYKIACSQMKEEHKSIMNLLDMSFNDYTTLASLLSTQQLANAIVVLDRDRVKILDQILKVEERKEYAEERAKSYFDCGFIDAEMKFNKIIRECTLELDKLKPQAHYYEAYIIDLGKRINRENDDNIKPIR